MVKHSFKKESALGHESFAPIIENTKYLFGHRYSKLQGILYFILIYIYTNLIIASYFGFKNLFYQYYFRNLSCIKKIPLHLPFTLVKRGWILVEISVMEKTVERAQTPF